ncbi:Uncharacterized protein BM_BM1439 [Brugia malayi]|uniref:Bm1439 n=1 Tax=Brugia malayi TaxID=6279 RepID=A0A0K0J117_BRUMA|nr:Uncharacterized protein BM_BM1439 [Brugia malayi]CDP98620.1 Bm1439 [Brugia malayi]VIO98813.1 Uncharacterized protein BM_BM1439 [Brugia malayi]
MVGVFYFVSHKAQLFLLSERIGLWFRSLNASPKRACNSAIFLDLGQNAEDHMGMFVWREVSVDGDIYNIRETRSSTKRGELLAGETNHFQPQIHNPLKSLTGLGNLIYRVKHF